MVDGETHGEDDPLFCEHRTDPRFEDWGGGKKCIRMDALSGEVLGGADELMYPTDCYRATEQSVNARLERIIE